MELRIKGITKTWFLNIFLVVILLILAFEVAMGFIVHNYYYTGVTAQITELANKYESSSLFSADADFETNARSLIERFENRTVAEMQVFDANDRVVISTSGFLPDYRIKPADYTEAFIAFQQGSPPPDPYVGYYGDNADEKIMATTVIIKGPDLARVGAVRFIISLQDIDRQISGNILVLALAGLGIAAFVLGSGIYFVQSIIKPVQAVNSVARRIARGDFHSRLEVRKADEIGELCDTINFMANELASAEQMKNDFISLVSHELRTPLTAIKGWGETMKGALETDPALLEKGTNVIVRESERLSGLVEELLDFSRMQSGHFSFDMQRIDILAEIEEAVYMYTEPARQAGVTLETALPEQVPPIVGDAGRLKQVFINIIDNAVKYSTTGGNVTINLAEEKGCIHITVTDCGVGIPAADVEHVKEKFYKANKTVRGSGIGLAVADQIIKQHNGLLLIKSREGEGTSVTIVLPTEPQDYSTTKAEKAAEKTAEQALPTNNIPHE